MTLDLAIRGGTLVTAADTTKTDIGIRDGKVVLIGHDLPDATRDIDAHGKLVLPGGVDSHVHIEQDSPVTGAKSGTDFLAATRSAACGGTTTLMPFCPPDQRPVAARSRQCLSQTARRQGRHRLCSAPDCCRSFATGSGAGNPGPDCRGLHLIEGLHDLRDDET